MEADTAAEYDGLSTNLPLTVTDDDAAIVVNRGTGALALMEGSAETYTVTLKGQPTGVVVVGVTSDDVGAVTAAPEALTYGTTNWNTGQTVTVAAAKDPDETAETVTVRAGADDDAVDDTVTWTHDPSGSDYGSVELTFTVSDDETRAVVVDTTAQAVTEDHATAGRAAYTVVLATQPVGGNVTVTITSSDSGAAAGPAQLVFTAGNWATERTVAQGDDDGDAESVTLTYTAVGGDYPTPPAVPVPVMVTVTDDDVPGLWVSTAAAGLAVQEGASGMYTVWLNTEPGGGRSAFLGRWI